MVGKRGQGGQGREDVRVRVHVRVHVRVQTFGLGTSFFIPLPPKPSLPLPLSLAPSLLSLSLCPAPPLATFYIMPTYALCNTAVPLGGIMAAGAGAAARHATVAPAFGVGAGLLIGKPIGIYGSTWLATKLGIADMPPGEW